MSTFTGITNALESFNEFLASFTDTVDAVVSAFADQLAYEGKLHIGQSVYCYHDETGAFNGHVCELRTERTVTVARESDGVLVHLPRSAVLEVEGRDD